MPTQSKKLRLTSGAGLKIIGLLIFAALFVHSYFIYQLIQDDKTYQAQTIKDILVDAVHALQSPLVVEPTSGRQFIPSMRLVLPAKTEERIFARSSGDDSTVLLISQASQSQAIAKMRAAKSFEDTFKELNVAQQCSRQVVLSFAPTAPTDTGDKYTLKQSKKLADGRTVHVFENECPYPADPMLRDLSNLQSL